jgi:hypothetical protein
VCSGCWNIRGGVALSHPYISDVYLTPTLVLEPTHPKTSILSSTFSCLISFTEAMEDKAQLGPSQTMGEAEKTKEESSSGQETPVEIEDLTHTELPVPELTQEETRKVMKKLDWWLIPQLSLLYLLAFLDRGNSEYYQGVFLVDELTMGSWKCESRRDEQGP